MKKVLALIVVVMLAATVFSGCKKEAAQGTVKTGLGVITSIANSKDSAEEDGLAEMYSTIVAVTVDKDGKIVKCVIDAAQTKVNFSKEGKLTTPLTNEFKTKNELGLAYNMKGVSGIKKEWNEQAAAFADYVEGKTASQVAGIAVDEAKHPTGSDLKSSVTVSVGDFIAGVQKAITNAKDYGAQADDKLGLGVITNINKSKDADADKAGVAQAYSSYALTTTDAQGKITSCVIDASQTNVEFDKSGKITSDLTAEQKTKNELGAAYNMKDASGIKKEWNEQAAAFADYVKGKTVADVKSIAISEDGKATNKDITATVTVSIDGFMGTIEKAVAGAK
ncbi:MAG: hypothetical protein PHR18_01765 [Oscillospiraceae bacterium]|nr:hypothetical protein [Oscillospiraceae bacterium]MDD3832614.1 hypothetical protein [Oscillospiraceae bacterium]